MKTFIALCAIFSSANAAFECLTAASGFSFTQTCEAGVNSCYATEVPVEGGITTHVQGCDYIPESCDDNEDGQATDCSQYSDQTSCNADSDCTWSPKQLNPFAAYMPSSAYRATTCCQMPYTNQLIALDASNFAGVTVDENWFTENCVNPVRCNSATASSISVIATLTAVFVALRNLF